MNATLTVKCPRCGRKSRQVVSADEQLAININLESPYCDACDEADYQDHLYWMRESEIRRQEQIYGDYSKERDPLHYDYEGHDEEEAEIIEGELDPIEHVLYMKDRFDNQD